MSVGPIHTAPAADPPTDPRGAAESPPGRLPLPDGAAAQVGAKAAVRAPVTIAYRRVPGKSPCVVFLTGYRSSMNGAKAIALEAYCRGAGHAFVRFDYQGHGETGGEFESCVLSTWIGDALAVVDSLTTGPLLLVGSSMGAWIAVRTALARPDRVAGLVTIAAAPDFTEVMMWNAFDPATRDAVMAGKPWRAPSPDGDSELIVSRELIEDGRKHLVLRGRIPLAFPVRLLHGTADKSVPAKLSHKLLEQIDSPDASLTLIRDGGHRLSKPHELGHIVRAAEDVLRQIDVSATSAARPSR